MIVSLEVRGNLVDLIPDEVQKPRREPEHPGGLVAGKISEIPRVPYHRWFRVVYELLKNGWKMIGMIVVMVTVVIWLDVVVVVRVWGFVRVVGMV